MDITIKGLHRLDSHEVDADGNPAGGRIVARSIVVVGEPDSKRIKVSKRGLCSLTLNVAQAEAMDAIASSVAGLTGLLGSKPFTVNLPDPGIQGRTIAPNVGTLAARLAALEAEAADK